jgi:hypothetical protein
MGTFYIQHPKLAYVHVPRTGMAMKKIIKEWLKRNFNVNDTDSWMIDHPHLGIVKDHYPDAKTMSVVRNPWQRVYSLYRKVSTEGYWLDWNNQTLLDLKPINEWIEDYCNPEVEFNFPRWFTRFTNQIDFVHVNDEWVDYICRAESLEQDFKQVKEYLNCDIPEFETIVPLHVILPALVILIFSSLIVQSALSIVFLFKKTISPTS